MTKITMAFIHNTYFAINLCYLKYTKALLKKVEQFSLKGTDKKNVGNMNIAYRIASEGIYLIYKRFLNIYVKHQTEN